MAGHRRIRYPPYRTGCFWGSALFYSLCRLSLFIIFIYLTERSMEAQGNLNLAVCTTFFWRGENNCYLILSKGGSRWWNSPHIWCCRFVAGDWASNSGLMSGTMALGDMTGSSFTDSSVVGASIVAGDLLPTVCMHRSHLLQELSYWLFNLHWITYPNRREEHLEGVTIRMLNPLLFRNVRRYFW